MSEIELLTEIEGKTEGHFRAFYISLFIMFVTLSVLGLAILYKD